MARRTQEVGMEEGHVEGRRYLPRPVPGGTEYIESFVLICQQDPTRGSCCCRRETIC